jgi:hypothetical protein
MAQRRILTPEEAGRLVTEARAINPAATITDIAAANDWNRCAFSERYNQWLKARNTTPQVTPQATPQVTPQPALDIQAIVQAVAQQLGYVIPQAEQPKPIAQVLPIEAKTEAGKHTFIFTTWEARVKPDMAFIKCLRQLAKYWDAQVFLTLSHAEDVELLPQSLRDFHLLTTDLRLNENCWFRYRPTNALVQRVTTGYEGVFNETAIIPALCKELVTLPISANAISAKQIMTSPSIGKLDAAITDYSNLSDEAQKVLSARFASIQHRRLGANYSKAQTRVSPAALIVQVLNNKHFVTRYVTAKQEGVLYDLDKKFTPDGWEDSRPLSLLAGDIHEWHKSDDAIAVVKSMAEVLRPRWGIVGDFFDGASCNRHEMDNPFSRAKAPTVAQEGNQAKAFLREMATWFDELKYLGSNHDNFLRSYIQQPKHWRPDDHYTCSKLVTFCHETSRHPIEALLEMDSIGNLRFIPENEGLQVGGVHTRHGHVGVSGGKPNFWQLAKTYWNYQQGHTHSPAAWCEAACAGLCEKLDPSYRLGASGWWTSNVLTQPDNALQLCSSVSDQWRRN